MKMDTLTRLCSTAAIAATCITANAKFFSDGFGTAHNYLADGAAGTMWDGFLVNFTNGNAVATLADADTSSEQCLTLQSTYGN